ncbi:hypothetical protein [Spirosoma sp. 48-14]|uniref:hypothetical protein n=1 Tax=Spirosoma sp. 48-14 TaxID=1895854 RepID=UPI000965FAD1|nr:hypothetical protein [Spirosoma sp. 48-14]OJW76337.1 MAG: hypothetical protein BGO59_22725 [Spirosoma sp. 48-14]
MKVALTQLLAAAQLAEMAYNADQVDHKKAAWEKAQTEYEQAAEAERQEQPVASPQPVDDSENGHELAEQLATVTANYQALLHENATLKDQLIEKELKIGELEKMVSSAKSPVPAAKKNS